MTSASGTKAARRSPRRFAHARRQLRPVPQGPHSRLLGYPAPGPYKRYATLASIKEEEGVSSSRDMIRQLVEGQEAVARTAFRLAEAANDQHTRTCSPAHEGP